MYRLFLNFSSSRCAVGGSYIWGKCQFTEVPFWGSASWRCVSWENFQDVPAVWGFYPKAICSLGKCYLGGVPVRGILSPPTTGSPNATSLIDRYYNNTKDILDKLFYQLFTIFFYSNCVISKISRFTCIFLNLLNL